MPAMARQDFNSQLSFRERFSEKELTWIKVMRVVYFALTNLKALNLVRTQRNFCLTEKLLE